MQFRLIWLNAHIFCALLLQERKTSRWLKIPLPSLGREAPYPETTAEAAVIAPAAVAAESSKDTAPACALAPAPSADMEDFGSRGLSSNLSRTMSMPGPYREHRWAG